MKHDVTPSPRQGEFTLEPRKAVGGALFSKTELRTALFQALPATGKVRRVELVDQAAAHLGLPPAQARAELNRLIADEKRAGRLELDAGWEHVWRA